MLNFTYTLLLLDTLTLTLFFFLSGILSGIAISFPKRRKSPTNKKHSDPTLERDTLFTLALYADFVQMQKSNGTQTYQLHCALVNNNTRVGIQSTSRPQFLTLDHLLGKISTNGSMCVLVLKLPNQEAIPIVKSFHLSDRITLVDFEINEAISCRSSDEENKLVFISKDSVQEFTIFDTSSTVSCQPSSDKKTHP